MSWQIYHDYDEDSLILFSNAGLLRRARKIVAVVELLSQDKDQLLFKVEDCEVRLFLEGITQAACDCSAQGSCKHILSSILWLQEHPSLFLSLTSAAESTDTSTSVSVSTEERLQPNVVKDLGQDEQLQSTEMCEDGPKSVLDHILALDHAKLQKKVAKADIRLAFELVQHWLQDPESCQFDLQSNRISFQTHLSSSPILLYPSTGFEGMLSALTDQHKNAAYLACIAYLFLKLHPEKWQWALNQVQIQQKSTTTLSLSEVECIEELKYVCQNLIQHGLSHLSTESVMSLHLLNMQARAQGLVRLGGLLRTLHGMMKQFLAHDVQVDEQILFNQLAHLYAYLAALTEVAHLHPDIQTETLIQLRGSAQRDYVQHQIPHLIPLGCEWWIAESGAHGLTVCFWDVIQHTIKEVTQARANHLDRSFDQNSAAHTGIWGSSLNYLLQHQIELSHAKASSDIQLSASAETRFLPKGLLSELTRSDFEKMQIGIANWQVLHDIIIPHSGLEPLQSRYVLLRHQKVTTPELNEFEQYFEFRVVDDENTALRLVLPIEPEYRMRIKQLTQLIQNNAEHGKMMATLVRIDHSRQPLQLIPCSLLLDSKQGLKIFSLDYDHCAPQKNPLSELMNGRIEKLLAQKKQWENQQKRSALDTLIIEIQALFEFYANTGRAKFDPDDEIKLNDCAQQFEDLGLVFVSHALRVNFAHHAMADLLLKWRHILLQLQRLNRRIALEGQVGS